MRPPRTEREYVSSRAWVEGPPRLRRPASLALSPWRHIRHRQVRSSPARTRESAVLSHSADLGDGSSLWLLPCYRSCRSTWEGDGMAELPRSLPEFEAKFPDDAACARWLLEKRWPD